MENLDKLDKLLGQFPGSRAVFYAKKLGWSRSKVYDNLNSLQIRKLAYNKNGLWYPSTEEKPSEVNPYVWLNEKERKLYRLDVEALNIIKRMAVASPEWVKRQEEEFRQKWGIVTP